MLLVAVLTVSVLSQTMAINGKTEDFGTHIVL